jgi:hypothetical protein
MAWGEESLNHMVEFAELHNHVPGLRTGRPVFIIGTERSGSNLLRLMLDAHHNITVPHPPHFMRYLAPLAASYGDLGHEANRRALVRDALTLLRRHIHPWEHPIDEEAVVAGSRPSAFGVMAEIYEQYRAAVGKSRWGCKSTFMVDYVADALAEYPGAQFVWLVRDPRDVAASAARSVFGPCHPRLTARLWAAQQGSALAALEARGDAVVHRMHYEQLVGRPEAELRRLCAFLDEPFEDTMLQFHRSPAALRLAALSRSWRNTARPVATTSVGNHRRDLAPGDRSGVEHIAGALMERLGYAVDRPPTGPVRRASGLGVRVRNAGQRIAIECRSMATDANHWRRWSRDLTARWFRVKAKARLVRRARES